MSASPAALRALLSEAIDYAGLFPPASLSMAETVQRYGAYHRSPHAWALGRLVVPALRLEELRDVLPAERPTSAPWPLAILLGADLDTDVAKSIEVASRVPGIRVDAIETGATDPGDVARIAERARAAADHFAAPLYAELPLDGDPRVAIAAWRRARVRAKARTGGVTPGAIPRSSQVLRFLEACVEADISFKVTAGLHHAIRGSHPLTYEANAPCATMHGFLNVFAAAALLAAGVATDAVEPLLDETDAAALRFDDEALEWRGHRASTEAVRRMRQRFDAFGSCSFDEPIDELTRQGLA